MTVQDIINELEQIKEKCGNLPIVATDPWEGYGNVREVAITENDAKAIEVSTGYYSYKAIKISLF